MTKINTNVPSLRGLRSLAQANKLLEQSLTRLSTGLQINTGKDNPSGLIASETLRSQLTVIGQSIKNTNRANNVIATADSALGEIATLLNQVRGLVQEGLNVGALSPEEIEANQGQIDAALNAINRISANTSFAGAKLIDGSKSFVTQMTAVDSAKLDDFQINQALFGSNATILIDATITTIASKGELFYDSISGGGGLASSTTLEISGAKGTDVLFFGATSTLDNIETAVDVLTDNTGVEASKTIAVYGSILIDSTPVDSDVTLTDIRTTNDDNAENITQVLKVEILAAGALDTLGVTSSSTATELKLTITLETDAGSLVLSDASDVKALLEINLNSSDFVSVTMEGTGAGTVDASLAVVNITSGAVDAFLVFRSSEFGSDQFVDISVLQGTFATVALSIGGSASARDEGTDIVATINGQLADGKGLKASVTTSLLEANVTFTSADNVANTNARITITGGGSLFQIGQEVSAAGQVGVGIEGINTARLGGVTGKLYELGSGGGRALADVTPGGAQGADLVQIIKEALDDVTGLRGRLGAMQKNVFDTNITTLGVALESISEARSQIIDTDFAAETAALTRAQILTQSGIAVLTIANQNPSQVLALLG